MRTWHSIPEQLPRAGKGGGALESAAALLSTQPDRRAARFFRLGSPKKGFRSADRYCFEHPKTLFFRPVRLFQYFDVSVCSARLILLFFFLRPSSRMLWFNPARKIRNNSGFFFLIKKLIFLQTFYVTLYSPHTMNLQNLKKKV